MKTQPTSASLGRAGESFPMIQDRPLNSKAHVVQVCLTFPSVQTQQGLELLHCRICPTNQKLLHLNNWGRSDQSPLPNVGVCISRLSKWHTGYETDEVIDGDLTPSIVAARIDLTHNLMICWG